MLFVTSGGHTLGGKHNGQNYLLEDGMTPNQTAYLAHILQPKCVSIIGI